MHKFLCYGVNVREVTLPLDDPDFKIVKDSKGDRFRANKIILGSKKSIFDIDVIKEFKLYLYKKFVDYDNIDKIEFIKNIIMFSL